MLLKNLVSVYTHRWLLILGAVFESLKREGLSILLVEQNLPLALRLADHVLSRGRIVHSSTPGELWTNDEVKARYLGV